MGEKSSLFFLPIFSLPFVAMPAPDAGMAFGRLLRSSSSSEETDDSAAAAVSSSPGPAAAPPATSSSSSSSLHHRRSRSRSKQRRVQVPAAAIHATAAVLCARVHSELAYAPASRAPEAAHALCLALDAALRCKGSRGGGAGAGAGAGQGQQQAGGGGGGEPLSSSSPMAFLSSSSSVSIAKVGAPTELPDAAFVAVALPATTTRSAALEAGARNSSSSSSASDKAFSESSSEEEKIANANAVAAAAAAAAAAAIASASEEELNTAPLVAALLRAAERLHAAVAQVRSCVPVPLAALDRGETAPRAEFFFGAEEVFFPHESSSPPLTLMYFSSSLFLKKPHSSFLPTGRPALPSHALDRNCLRPPRGRAFGMRIDEAVPVSVEMIALES